MNRNFMVKKVGTEAGFKRVTKVLSEHRIHWYVHSVDDGKLIKVNVGGTKKRTTKRFDICKELGFKELGADI